MKANKDYKYREIAGEHYLIPVGVAAEKTPAPIQLSETAAWIWRQIEKGVSDQEMAEEMTLEYEVDPARARAAVEQFLIRLREQGLAE